MRPPMAKTAVRMRPMAASDRLTAYKEQLRRQKEMVRLCRRCEWRLRDVDKANCLFPRCVKLPPPEPKKNP